MPKYYVKSGEMEEIVIAKDEIFATGLALANHLVKSYVKNDKNLHLAKRICVSEMGFFTDDTLIDPKDPRYQGDNVIFYDTQEVLTYLKQLMLEE